MQLFYPCAAVAIVSFLGCLILRGGQFGPYVPVFVLIWSLVLVIALGMTLVPYVALRRGPMWRYFATVLLLPPAMIFISLSNAPSIVKTLFGRRESFKRTPKSDKARQEAPASD